MRRDLNHTTREQRANNNNNSLQGAHQK